MEILRGLTPLSLGPSAVAIGCFDGVHLGHRRVIAGVCQSGLTPVAFTFDRGSQLKGAPAITTCTQKLKLLEECGVRAAYVTPFSLVSQMSAGEFVTKVLRELCGAKKVFCGVDFRFGAGRSAGISELQTLCSGCGMEAEAVPPVLEGGLPVSSTRIRERVRRGDVEGAALLLGRRFGFDFPVARGRQLGRRLGAPTINQPFPQGFVLPLFGVYASVVTLPQGRFSGVTNVGIKPTVGSEQPLAETWIDGYEGELYGEKVQVELFSFLRPEKRFSGLEELKEAIAADCRAARAITAGALQTGKGVL